MTDSKANKAQVNGNVYNTQSTSSQKLLNHQGDKFYHPGDLYGFQTTTPLPQIGESMFPTDVYMKSLAQPCYVPVLPTAVAMAVSMDKVMYQCDMGQKSSTIQQLQPQRQQKGSETQDKTLPNSSASSKVKHQADEEEMEGRGDGENEHTRPHQISDFAVDMSSTSSWSAANTRRICGEGKLYTCDFCGKYFAQDYILRCTDANTLARSHFSAKSARNNLLVETHFRFTGELTQEKNHTSATFAFNSLPNGTTSQSTSARIRVRNPSSVNSASNGLLERIHCRFTDEYTQVKNRSTVTFARRILLSEISYRLISGHTHVVKASNVTSA